MLPYIWLGLIVLFIVAEAATMDLATIWFAIGALFAFLLSLLYISPWIQFAVFLISSIVLLYYTRPLAKKYLQVGKHATNAESLIGREGIVLKPIEKHNTGQVKVWGQIWTAVSKADQEIPVETLIRVLAIEGVKLVVEPVEETKEQTEQ